MSARTATNEEARAQLNEQMFTSVLPDFSLTDTMVKFAIGYAYGIVGWIASWNIAVMLALMTNIVVLQYVILFAVLAALLVGLVYTTPVVTSTLFDSGKFVAAKAKSLFASAKERVAAMRSTATVH